MVCNNCGAEVDGKRGAICPKCGSEVIEKHGKYGTFYGCSNYPDCRFVANFEDFDNGFNINEWREMEFDKILDGEYIASLNGGD